MPLLQERFGLLFSDSRQGSFLVIYYPLMFVLRDIIAGLLIGIQEGESLLGSLSFIIIAWRNHH